MSGEYDKILAYVRKAALDNLTARVKNVEEVRLKKVEDVLKGQIEVSTLKDAVKKQSGELDWALKNFPQQINFAKNELTRTYTALVATEVSKMERKLEKTELLEARLKGMETMIRAIEQNIDMLQRKR